MKTKLTLLIVAMIIILGLACTKKNYDTCYCIDWPKKKMMQKVKPSSSNYCFYLHTKWQSINREITCELR